MQTSVTALTSTPEGGTERAGFFGPDGALFGYTHMPPAGPLGGLLICSPLHGELGKNYSREVLLARNLAARGIVVQRFHYRGSGHSAGSSTELTFDSLVEDAQIALEQLEVLTQKEPVAFLGTRLGALVASVPAGRRRGAPVILWEPSGSARQHFRAVMRAGIVRGLKSGDAADAPAQFSLSRLETDGMVDVLGYPITWPLYESLADKSIPIALGDEPRAVQIVQFGGRRPGRPEVLALAEQLASRRATTSVELLDAEESWWFGGTNDNRWTRAASLALARLVIALAVRALGRSQAGFAMIPDRVDAYEEIPVFFPAGDNMLFGVLTTPSDRPDAASTAVVLVPGGCTPPRRTETARS